MTAYGHSANLRAAKSGCLSSWSNHSHNPLGEPSYQLNEFLAASNVTTVSGAAIPSLSEHERRVPRFGCRQLLAATGAFCPGGGCNVVGGNVCVCSVNHKKMICLLARVLSTQFAVGGAAVARFVSRAALRAGGRRGAASARQGAVLGRALPGMFNVEYSRLLRRVEGWCLAFAFLQRCLLRLRQGLSSALIHSHRPYMPFLSALFGLACLGSA